eukprot:1161497-Pelagomonas_calceolata.AAC.5
MHAAEPGLGSLFFLFFIGHSFKLAPRPLESSPSGSLLLQAPIAWTDNLEGITYAVPVLKLRAPDRHNINPFPSLNTASAVQSQGYTLLPTNPANLQHTLIRAYSRHDISLKKQEPIKCAKDESDVVMRCSEAVFWLHHFSV